jgi:hypothetical protein
MDGAAIGSSQASTIPHTPPQNADEMTIGTPSGGTAAMFQAGPGALPAAP